MKTQWPVWLAALWWGSLTTIGFGVVPLLFVHLPSAAMAGSMAARLFSAQTWVSVSCGLILLMQARSDQAAQCVGRVPSVMVFVVGGMMLALLSEFAVAPRIVARENLPVWHSIGSLMYGLQWLCAAASLWKLMPPPPQGQV